jgi:hypothetical protein
MVQSDIDSDSGGALTVLISPNLVASLADNEAVTVNKPSLLFILKIMRLCIQQMLVVFIVFHLMLERL